MPERFRLVYKARKVCLVPTTKISFIGYMIDSIGSDNCPILKINSERVRKLRKEPLVSC